MSDDQAVPTDLETEKIIARGAGISSVGMVASGAFGYLMAIVVARGVGGSQFGVLNLALATIFTLLPLAVLGLNHGGLRFVARLRARSDRESEIQLARHVSLLVFLWGVLVAVAAVLFAEPIARLFGHDVELISSLVRRLAPVLPFSALLMVLGGLADGQKKVEYGVLASGIVMPLSALILAGILLWVGAGIKGVVWAYWGSRVLAVLLALYLLRSYYVRRSDASSSQDRFSLWEVVSFSVPFLPMTFFRDIGARLEVYFLGFLGTSLDVGIFSAASSSARLVAFGLRAIWKIYGAVAAEMYEREEMRQLEHALQLATRWSVVVGLPAALALILFGQDVLALFGAQFGAGSLALLILTAGQFINAAVGPTPTTLMIAGRSKLILVNNVATVTLNIALDWWLISRWGLVGAAVGATVARAALNLLSLIEVRVLLGISAYNRFTARPLLAAGLTVGLMWPLVTLMGALPTLVRLIVGLPTMGLIFCGLFWVLAPGPDRKIVVVAVAYGRRTLLELLQKSRAALASLSGMG